MELNQIRYFLEVCDTLNFTRAAEQCHVSQPALTRSVKKLEDELGGELFRRERSRTHLTDLGHKMRPLLRQSLDGALAAKARAERYGQGEATTLKLGISATIDIRILLPAFQELSRSMPGLELHLIRKPSADIMQQLEDGEIELCVSAVEDVTWQRIDQWPLYTEDFVLLAGAGHPLGSASAIALKQLNGQQFLTRRYCEHAQALSDVFAEHGIEAAGFHQLSDQSDMDAFVGKGLGVGVAPQSTKVSDNVVPVVINDIGMQRTVSLFAVAGREYSLPASGLVQLLRAADWPARLPEIN